MLAKDTRFMRVCYRQAHQPEFTGEQPYSTFCGQSMLSAKEGNGRFWAHISVIPCRSYRIRRSFSSAFGGLDLEREPAMPGISSDIVDAYLFRRNRGHAEYLLLRRRSDSQLGGTWHAVHGRIDDGESSVDAARRAVRMQTGLEELAAYSADYINQFFDHLTDTIVLAPVLAFEVIVGRPIALAAEFDDYAWCDREEATGRLAFASQRWAVRHIEDIIAQPSADSEMYRIP